MKVWLYSCLVDGDGDPTDQGFFVPFFIDLARIDGFYRSQPIVIDGETIQCMNIFLNGNELTIGHDPYLEKLLLNKYRYHEN